MDINSVKVELFTKLRELQTVGNIESQCWIGQAENLLNYHLNLRCILIPKSMPTELLCDVFSFTKREDLFSCQLVNRQWNLVIETNLDILSLKYFLGISICLKSMLPARQNDFINLPILQIEKSNMSGKLSIGTLEHEYECMIAKSFVKYGVFEFCEVNGNSWYPAEIPAETIALLERIQSLTGRKIRARGLYGPVDVGSLMALKKYIDFEEVTETWGNSQTSYSSQF